MNPIALTSTCQKDLLEKLAHEHRLRDKLLTGVSPGTLQKVVVAVSLASIVLTSAVLVRMLGGVLPDMVAHALH